MLLFKRTILQNKMSESGLLGKEHVVPKTIRLIIFTCNAEDGDTPPSVPNAGHFIIDSEEKLFQRNSLYDEYKRLSREKSSVASVPQSTGSVAGELYPTEGVPEGDDDDAFYDVADKFYSDEESEDNDEFYSDEESEDNDEFYSDEESEDNDELFLNPEPEPEPEPEL